MKNVLKASVLALVLSTASFQSMAAKPGFTLGEAFSFATIKNQSTSASGYVFGTPYHSSPEYTDDKGYALDVYAEYNFNSWFGLGASIGYANDFSSGYAVNQNSGSSKISVVKFKAYNESIYARFAYTFDDKGSDVFLKTGLAFVQTKYESNNLGFDQSKNSIAPLVGIGAQYYLSDNLAIRGGIDYIIGGIQSQDGYAASTRGVPSNASLGELKGDLIKFNLGLAYTFK